MKHGKRPTVRQMKIIQSNRLNHENWLVSKEFPQKLLLIHRYTNRAREVIKI